MAGRFALSDESSVLFLGEAIFAEDVGQFDRIGGEVGEEEVEERNEDDALVAVPDK